MTGGGGRRVRGLFKEVGLPDFPTLKNKMPMDGKTVPRGRKQDANRGKTIKEKR